MFKTILVASVCFTILANSESTVIRALHNRGTTTEKPEELTASGNDRVPAGYYKVNNIPKVGDGCVIKYDCKKKLKHAEIPKPCVKFCVKSIECENGRRIIGEPHQCLELNEELVSQEYNDCKNDEDSNSYRVMPVAMIDFPCQPGYLPDSRGRCREVW